MKEIRESPIEKWWIDQKKNTWRSVLFW